MCARVLTENMMVATAQVLLCPYCGKHYEDSVSFDEHLVVHEPETGQNDSNCESSSHTVCLLQNSALTSYGQSAGLEKHDAISLPKKSLSDKTSVRINIVSYTLEKSPILSKGEAQREIDFKSVNESSDEATGFERIKGSYSDGKCSGHAGTQSVFKPDNVVQTDVHITEKPHQCGYCEERFSSLQGLRSHIVIHIKDKVQENKNDAIQDDEKECSDGPNLLFQECKTNEYPLSARTTTHMMEDHKQRYNSLYIDKHQQVCAVGKHHQCFRCAVLAPSSEMKKHLNSLPKERLTKKLCTESKTQLEMTNSLQVPDTVMPVSKSLRVSRRNTRSHQCVHCDKVFLTAAVLRMHMQKHTYLKDRKEFDSPSKANGHPETEISIGKTVQEKNNVKDRNHQKTPANTLSDEMMSHAVDSQDDSSHCEQQCDIFGISQKTSKFPTNVHTSKPVAAVAGNRVSRRNTKSHLCVYCDKVFLTAVVLRVHMLKHTSRKGEKEVNAPSEGNSHPETEISSGKIVQIAVETADQKIDAEGKAHKQPLDVPVGERAAGGMSDTEMEDNPQTNEHEDTFLDSSCESNLEMDGTLVREGGVSQHLDSRKPLELPVGKNNENQLRKKIHMEDSIPIGQKHVHQNGTDTEWEIYSDRETDVQDNEIKKEWELQVDEGTDRNSREEDNSGIVCNDLSNSSTMHNDEAATFQTSQSLCKESIALPCPVNNMVLFDEDSSLLSGSNLLLQGHSNTTEAHIPTVIEIYLERQKNPESRLLELEEDPVSCTNDIPVLKTHSAALQLYKCNKCSKVFEHESILNTHLESHVIENPKHMSTSYSRTQNMESKIDSPYMCSICKKSFTLRPELTQHVLTHKIQGVKPPYECSICNHKYSTILSLTNHIKLHTHCNSTSDRTKNFKETRETIVEESFYLESQPHIQADQRADPDGGPQFQQNTKLNHSSLSRVKTVEEIKNQPKIAVDKERSVTGSTSKSIPIHVLKTCCTEKQYLCYHCKRAFSNPTDLYRHTLVHTCPFCPQCFCQRSFLEDDMTSHREDNYTSAACGKELGVPCRLEQNMETHAETNPYECSSCDEGSKSLTSLERRMIVHHKESQGYQCYICGKSFTKCTDLEKHMTKRVRKKSRVCPFCGRKCVDLSVLRRHTDHSHYNKSPHECVHCEQMFLNQQTFRAHTCHPEKKEYECCHCSVRFISLSTFTKHVASVKPGVSLYVCLACGQRLANDAELTFHVTTYHQNVYTCSYCGKGIRNKELFWKHFSGLKTTTNKDGHQCCVCGMIFGVFLDLKEHITTHVHQDHSRCMTCVKGFAEANDLQNHLDSHLDIGHYW